MSSMLAIASVTAVLKNLLDNALTQTSVTASVGDVVVTVLPPDRIASGSDERSQLNLYLYRVTPNSSWRRSTLCSNQTVQAESLPLALDLHYLLTAYGERDFHAEILLGHAIQILHENPELTIETTRAALAHSGEGLPPPLADALSTGTLVEQLEQVSVSPEFLSMEDMSKLWSSLQAHARLSATYLASMVLIEDRRTLVETADEEE